MPTSHDLSVVIDDLVKSAFTQDEPGVAVIVTQAGEVIYRKGYGMANLELGVQIQPDMVFRLGSITKQFTAVAILILLEQGKLALDDSITKFLPDYPTHDHLITIEHLLTHTSGIKSYTTIPEWWSLQTKDFTVSELIDFFKYQPMQFAPGKQWIYNNSGYILLGAIIEKISGLTYGEFIQQHIFDVLGMKHSYYDVAQRIIPQRVCGYQTGANGYLNANYLSMTQPYAAGSLAANVDDLAIWDAALYTNKLVPQKTLQQAFTTYKLIDGSLTNYGYGWFISDYEGHRLVEHSGSINGFSTHAIRVPDDQIFVAVLSNSESKGSVIQQLIVKIVALTIGKPYQEPQAVQVNSEILATYTGVYQLNEALEIIITCQQNTLFCQGKSSTPQELIAISPIEFIFKSNSFSKLQFIKNTEGTVAGVELHIRLKPPEVAKKTAKPLPESSSTKEKTSTGL